MSNTLLETLSVEVLEGKSVGPITLGGASLLLLRGWGGVRGGAGRGAKPEQE